MAEQTATGVLNKRGKCQIRWAEGKIRRYETLPIAYNKAGIDAARKIRAKKIRAFLEGHEEDNHFVAMPTFGQMAQDKLNEIKLGKPSSYRSIKSRLNLYWMPALSGHLLTQVKPMHIQQIVNEMRRLGRSKKYIKVVLDAGSSVFSMGIENEFIASNPAISVSKKFNKKSGKKKPIDPFVEKEIDAIFQHLSDEDKLFYSIRWYCGLRPGEVIALTRQDIRDGKIYVNKSRVEGHLGTTKTETERDVPLHPQITKLMAKRVVDMRDPHLFLTYQGKPHKTGSHFGERFAKAMQLAEVRYRNPYNVRHGAACRMLAAGMRPGWCAEKLGHSLEMFFTTYAQWIDQDESKAQEEIFLSMS